jgi:hypothetical protein
MRYDTLIVEPLRDMMGKVVSFIPTLLVAFGILIIGCVIAHAIERLLTRVLKMIEFDKVSDKMGLTRILKTGGITHKASEVLGCLTYYVLMIMVLIMTVKAMGLVVASALVDKILAYVPHVISGVLVLIIGMYLARFVSALVYIAAKNTDMPSPATLGRISKLAIMVYVTILFLKEIGFVSLFVGTHYTIFIGGVVFAMALAFGLAGKDIAGRYLDVLRRKPAHK